MNPLTMFLMMMASGGLAGGGMGAGAVSGGAGAGAGATLGTVIAGPIGGGVASSIFGGGDRPPGPQEIFRKLMRKQYPYVSQSADRLAALGIREASRGSNR